jgi:hypothetical protein
VKARTCSSLGSLRHEGGDSPFEKPQQPLKAWLLRAAAAAFAAEQLIHHPFLEQAELILSEFA